MFFICGRQAHSMYNIAAGSDQSPEMSFLLLQVVSAHICNALYSYQLCCQQMRQRIQEADTPQPCWPCVCVFLAGNTGSALLSLTARRQCPRYAGQSHPTRTAAWHDVSSDVDGCHMSCPREGKHWLLADQLLSKQGMTGLRQVKVGHGL